MKELRCLVFSEQEVVAAISERRKRLHEQLTDGSIHAITYQAQAEGGVSATLHTVNIHGAELPVIIQDTELSAALVNFCMSRKIPMPVDSDKYLQVINDGLTLMITMRFNKAHKSGSAAD